MAAPQSNTAEVPPYYDRFQEEREKRYESELHRVEEAIERNGKRIDELKADLKEEINHRFEEVNRRVEDVNCQMRDLKEEMNHRFESLETGINRRFDEQAKWFKSTFVTMMSVIVTMTLGVLAILIKLFVS